MTNTIAPVVVAVDGPAGSGKSSVSRAAADALGYRFLDTGAAYRALAWQVLDRGVDPRDEEDVLDELGRFDYAIATDPADRWVRVGSTDVTEAIREPRISAAVSAIARVPAVREHVTGIFRGIIAAAEPGIVVEGRDITTVVAPDAAVRILLTASPEVRAARRAGELGADAAQTAAAIAARDAKDSQVVDFMTAAPGVTTVDSTDLDFAATVAAVVDLVRGIDSVHGIDPAHPIDPARGADLARGADAGAPQTTTTGGPR